MDNEVRDQIIVDLKQGKDGYDSMDEEEIAQEIGISRQRVNQVIIRLLGASKFITKQAGEVVRVKSQLQIFCGHKGMRNVY